MKGVILAGGSGSRLSPLTRAANKHLLPVGREPMIFHPIKKLVQAGVEEIFVVTGTEHAGGVYQLLGSGREFGCQFSFRVQDEAGGIAHALYLARGFAANAAICVLLGDNIFDAPLRPLRQAFEAQAGSPKAMIALSEVKDPERFGVAVLSEDRNRIVKLVEKPKAPAPSPYAIAGIYFYQGEETFDIIRSLRPSARGELEITDLNAEFLRRGTLGFTHLPGSWSDAGTFDSLRAANLLSDTEGV